MWSNTQETGDLVIFTEEIINGKLHFLCSGKTFSPRERMSEQPLSKQLKYGGSF